MRFSGGGGWRGGVCAKEFSPQRTQRKRTAKGKEQRGKRRAKYVSSSIAPCTLRLARNLPSCPLWLNLPLINDNSHNVIAAGNLIHDVHAANDSSENGVTSVEMRLRRMSDEPLRAASVFAGQRHPHGGALKRHFIYLAANCVARPAILIAARVACLYDKIGHDARNRLTVEITLFRQLDEVVHVQRGIVRQKLDRE